LLTHPFPQLPTPLPAQFEHPTEPELVPRQWSAVRPQLWKRRCIGCLFIFKEELIHTTQILNNKDQVHILLFDNFLVQLLDQHYYNVEVLYHNYDIQKQTDGLWYHFIFLQPKSAATLTRWTALSFTISITYGCIVAMFRCVSTKAKLRTT
jgi:hypothetical protein